MGPAPLARSGGYDPLQPGYGRPYSGEGWTGAAPPHSPPVSPQTQPQTQPQPHVQPSAQTSAYSYPGPPASRRARSFKLRLTRVDPWSVMKVGFLLSVAFAVATFIAVAVLWSVLDAMGVFTSVGQLVNDVMGTEAQSGFELVEFLSLSRVLRLTTMIALVDIVLITALAALGAWLYNLAAGFVGGLEVTLADDE
ncbi:MAG: DUF3566 domain-containing protein [Carbonactinosporaceae bacterium]